MTSRLTRPSLPLSQGSSQYNRYQSMTSRCSLIAGDATHPVPIGQHQLHQQQQQQQQHPLIPVTGSSVNTAAGLLASGDLCQAISADRSMTSNPSEHQRRYRQRTRKSKTQLREYLQVITQPKILIADLATAKLSLSNRDVIGR